MSSTKHRIGLLDSVLSVRYFRDWDGGPDPTFPLSVSRKSSIAHFFSLLCRIPEGLIAAKPYKCNNYIDWFRLIFWIIYLRITKQQEKSERNKEGRRGGFLPRLFQTPLPRCFCSYSFFFVRLPPSERLELTSPQSTLSCLCLFYERQLGTSQPVAGYSGTRRLVCDHKIGRTPKLWMFD